MKGLTDTFTLHNGYKIPCVGFGTWQTPDGETAVQAVKSAIENGYRHIDTAAYYFVSRVYVPWHALAC